MFNQSAEPFSLPSIHEMFPEHFNIPSNAGNKSSPALPRDVAAGKMVPTTLPNIQQSSVKYDSHTATTSFGEDRGNYRLAPSHASNEANLDDPRSLDSSSVGSCLTSMSKAQLSALSVDTYKSITPSAYCEPLLDVYARQYVNTPTLRDAFSRLIVDQPKEEDRRHICPHCGKRFNRPSSLAIHINTHTGAKPFICPFPGCNRRFNVNSNMRRHHRNHYSSSRSPIDSSLQLPTIPFTPTACGIPPPSPYTIPSKETTSHSLQPASRYQLSESDYDYLSDGSVDEDMRGDHLAASVHYIQNRPRSESSPMPTTGWGKEKGLPRFATRARSCTVHGCRCSHISVACRGILPAER